MWRNRIIANGPTEERARDRMLLGNAVGSPSIDLVFTSGYLDPRIDFQRTTTGTYYRGPFNQNLLRHSQNYTQAVWVGFASGTGSVPVITVNAAVAPDGTMTANRVVMNRGNGTTNADRSLILSNQGLALVANAPYTFSVWMRGTVGGEVVTVRTVATTDVPVTLTTSWQRFSFTTNALNSNPSMWVCGNVATTSPLQVMTIEVWGAQLTEGSSLTPYIPTTTAAITQGQIAAAEPWNLFVRSEEFNTTWGVVATGAGSNPVVTANAAVAPDGTTTADQIAFNCGGLTSSDRSIIRQTLTGFTSGSTVTLSVWLKSATGNTQYVQFHVDGGTGPITYAIGPDWQRVSYSYAITAGATGLELRGNNSQAVTTSSVYAWGAQVNQGSAPLEYRSTTTAALWLPRFENDPITGEARGLLVEGGATNLCLQSAAVRTSPWSVTGFAAAGTSITAPDGTANGVELVPASGTANANTLQIINAAAATAYSWSIYFKPKGTALNTTMILRARNGGTVLSDMSVVFDHATGSTTGLSSGTWTGTSATAIGVGNGWYRIVLSGTSPATTTNVVTFVFFTGTGDGVNGVYAWGSQLEAQAFASSYIPTTTATVARGADTALMTGTNFSSWYNQAEGTIFAISQGLPQGAPTGVLYQVSDGTTSERHLAFPASGGSSVTVTARTHDNGVQNPAFAFTGINSLLPVRVAYAYASGNYGGSCNGSNTQTAASSGTPTVNQLAVGSINGTTTWINTPISRFAYWPTRLPDATLQALTT